jgi:hypothetical protein
MDTFLQALAKLAARLHCLPEADIRHMYVSTAVTVAHARVQGRPVLTEKMVNAWRFWEVRYAALGYRTFPLPFVEASIHERANLFDSYWHNPRSPGERPILHARQFRQNFLEGA